MAVQIFTGIGVLLNTRDNASLLRGPALRELPSVQNAYLVVEDGIIAGFGPASENRFVKQSLSTPPGTIVLPCWCDSHTHLVFADSREDEFVDRINGLSYAEIASRGGGILNSAKKLNEATEDALFNGAWQRLNEIIRMGTGAVEIKSGYGLSVEGELKMLRVIKRLKEKSAVTIKATFLGAHTYPAAFRQSHGKYIESIVDEMLPVIAAEKLADYVDVFCEKGFFSPEEMVTICNAAKRFGIRPKLHVNQLSSIGGIEAGVSLDAISLDHLETLTDNDIFDLSRYKGIATLLPSAAFFLNAQMPPARKLIDAGAAVSLASDFNPGSSPSGNMNLVVALACIQLRMLPEEAVNAATTNAAYAMEVDSECGTISIGKKANLIFTKPVPSLAYIPYSFGNNLIEKVMINGSFV